MVLWIFVFTDLVAAWCRLRMIYKKRFRAGFLTFVTKTCPLCPHISTFFKSCNTHDLKQLSLWQLSIFLDMQDAGWWIFCYPAFCQLNSLGWWSTTWAVWETDVKPPTHPYYPSLPSLCPSITLFCPCPVRTIAHNTIAQTTIVCCLAALSLPSMMHCVKSMFVVREAYFCTLLGVFADYIPLQVFQLFYVYFDSRLQISQYNLLWNRLEFLSLVQSFGFFTVCNI